MSMGSDYASGYNLGLNTRDDTADWSYLKGTASNALEETLAPLKYGRGGGGGSAQQIKESAAMQALKIKEAELNNREKEINNAQLSQNMDIQKATSDENIYNARRARTTEGITTAKTEVATAGTEVDKQEQVTHAKLLEDAMRGAYTGDTQAIKRYFDVNGTPGVSLNQVKRNGDGSIWVDFGNGKDTTFTNPKEFIDQVITPAAAIQSSRDKGITGYQQAELGIKEKGLAQGEEKISTTSTDKATSRQEALRKEANKSYEDRINKGEDEEKLGSRANYISKYIKDNQTALGVDTSGDTGSTTGLTTDTSLANQAAETGKEAEGLYNNDIANERSLADAAIKSGTDQNTVKKLFKQRTGQDY